MVWGVRRQTIFDNTPEPSILAILDDFAGGQDGASAARFCQELGFGLQTYYPQ